MCYWATSPSQYFLQTQACKMPCSFRFDSYVLFLWLYSKQKTILRNRTLHGGADKPTPPTTTTFWNSCDHGQNSERFQQLQCSHIARRFWVWVPAKGFLIQSQVASYIRYWCVRPSDAERIRVPLKFFIRLERFTGSRSISVLLLSAFT